MDKDIQTMRNLFWLKYEGSITQEELESEVKKIMDRQLDLL